MQKDNKDSKIDMLIKYNNDLAKERCKKCKDFQTCLSIIADGKEENCIWFNRLWAAYSDELNVVD